MIITKEGLTGLNPPESLYVQALGQEAQEPDIELLTRNAHASWVEKVSKASGFPTIVPGVALFRDSFQKRESEAMRQWWHQPEEHPITVNFEDDQLQCIRDLAAAAITHNLETLTDLKQIDPEPPKLFVVGAKPPKIHPDEFNVLSQYFLADLNLRVALGKGIVDCIAKTLR